MNKITFPLRLEMRNPEVQNLQDALQMLLDRGIILVSNENIRQQLTAAIQPEREQQLFGNVTAKVVAIFQRERLLEASGTVDEPTADSLNRILGELGLLEEIEVDVEEYTVSGQVANPDGAGITGLIVRAYDKCLGKENELAVGRTDTDGRYSLTYQVDQLINPARKQANLLVRVSSPANDPKTSSPLIINALAHEVVNLVIGEESYRGPDLYSRIHERLTEYLEDVALDDIEPRDLYCLANNTELNTEWVHHYIRARQWEKQWEEFPAEVFFAWFRSGLPTEWGNLLSRNLDELTSSIEQAAEKNHVSRATLLYIEKLDASLIEWRSNYVITGNDRPVSQASLGQLLEASALSQEQSRALIRQWQTFEGEASKFWAAQRDVLGETVSDDLDLTLQLGALTRNHLPLINTLKNQADIRRFTDIARFTKEDWLRLFKESNLEMPSDLLGENVANQQQAYAEALTRLTESLLPTRVLAEAFRRDTDFDSEQLDRFFLQNQEFEYRSQSVRSYLEDNPDALADFSDPASVQLELEALQRVFHLCPAINRQAVAKVLWQNQMHSAWAIMLQGEEALIDLFKDEQTTAKKVYKQAQSVHQVSYAVWLQSLDQNNSFGFVFPPGMYKIEGSPDLESLFGAQGYCECKHCMSFFSPSAYLVDLYLYLQKARLSSNNASAPVDTVLEKLFERRPDLGNIKLDCENAMTPLPYIDLINEVLENAILPRAYTYTPTKIGNKTFTLPFAIKSDPVPQTEADPDTLKAYPQHLNPDVYQILQTGDQEQGLNYPWNLPFNLWAEEVRVYLGHLDVPRWQLMESAVGQGSAASDVASEYLGLTPAKKQILLDTDSIAGKLDQYWGIPGALGKLATVETFLKQSGFSYEQLLQLLELRYVQGADPDLTLAVKFNPIKSCQVIDAELENLNGIALSRIHRLGRLERKTGETLIHLDQVVMAFGGEINKVFLENYAYLLRTQQILSRRIRLHEILSWWSLLDTHDYPDQTSLYRSLFLDPGISQPVKREFNLHKVQNEIKNVVEGLTTVLDLADPTLAPDLQAQILGALQWTMPELKAAVSDEWESASFDLNLANLSYLYRVSSFCRALRIKVPEYLALKAILGRSALPGPNEIGLVRPQDSHAFIHQLRLIESVGFDAESLDYLLRHQYRTDATFALGADEVGQILFDLQLQLNKLLNEVDPEGMPIAEKTQIKLTRILLPEDVATLRQILEKDPEFSLSEQEQKDFVDEKLNFFPDPSDAKMQLIEGGLTTSDERYSYVLEKLVPYLVENAAVQQLAESIGIATELVDSLLRSYLLYPSKPALSAIRAFFAPAFLNAAENSVFTTDDFSDQFDIVIRLQKIGLLIKNLRLDADAIRFIMDHGVETGLPDFSQIPLVPTSNALPAGAFASWVLLMELVRINRSYFQNNTSVFEVLSYPHELIYNLLEHLSAATRWDLTDLIFLTEASGLNLTDPPNDQLGNWLVKLAGTMPLVAKVGASARQIAQWTIPEITRINAESVRHAVKAKYGNEQWLEINAPLRDRIREQQRDALLSFVLHHRRKHNQTRFTDVDDLYGHYLIDPQMSACAMTSRTVLASSSVQLLVQRILMNLEPDMAFSRKHAEEWKWRRYYRVWEANRKVFLWPENWIEPELRDDKSPFFQELENELLQDELNDETVERVYVNYLYKLNEVARLKICGVHYETESRTLHIFALTAGNPPTCYYRRWENRRDWTAWEKVELDIYNAEGLEESQTGVSLLPVVHNRRLFLFWPIFALKQDEPNENEKKEIDRLEEELEAYKKERDRMRTQLTNIMNKTIELLENIVKWQKEINEPTSAQAQTDAINNLEAGKVRLDELIKSQKETKTAKNVYNEGIENVRSQINKIIQGHAYFSVKMAYSHYRQGHWTAKKLTNEDLRTPYFEGDFSRAKDIRRYFFIPTKTDQGGELKIKWYYSDGTTYYKLRSYFKYDACLSELIPCVNVFNPHITKGKLPDWMEYMKAKDNANGLKVPLRVTNAANQIDLLLNKAANHHLLSYSLDQGVFKQTTPFFYEDEQRTFLVVPPVPRMRIPIEGSSGLASQILAGKTELLQNQAFQKVLKPALEPQGIANKVQLLRKGTVSRQFYQVGEADRVMIRPAVYSDSSAVPDKSLTDQSNIQNFSTHDFSGISNIYTGVSPSEIKLHPPGRYIFRNFYHPYVCLFLKQLNRYGIEGLLNPNPNTTDGNALHRQATPEHDQLFWFSQVYDPNGKEVNRNEHPKETITFDYEDAYASYNWELFFHIPLLIATRLFQDQRFEAAQQWFHYIFNPMETEGQLPYRFWKIKPFHSYHMNQIEADMELLFQGEKTSQIQAWQAEPFNPHLLARFRRLAYMKTTVMKYLDNLIAWGDQLFRRDSIESLNEASQLYILAGQILGKLPMETEAKDTKAETFNELAVRLDALGNAWVELELKQQSLATYDFWDHDSSTGNPDVVPSFCFPPNEKLLAYWDTVADRLFKIRNCMNIEGMVRQLPLFQPPIDPALLVRAAASGMDLSSALNDLYAPLPHYRFTVMIQKAQEICQELKSLGGALLSALEKKDAEALALMRTQQEAVLLKANREIRAKQIEEAKHTLEGLNEQQKLSKIRFENYRDRDFINPAEIAAFVLSRLATISQGISVGVAAASAAAYQAPDIYSGGLAGMMGGPIMLANITSGQKAGNSIESISKWIDLAAIILKDLSEANATMGSYQRRQEDWDLQIDLAKQEIKQIDKQILASEIRIAIAEKDKENLELQITQSQTIADFMRNKYTDQQLYGWMVGQLASVYFQTYQLAYDIAKQAEKTFRYELGIEKSNYIQFGYWDNLRKGLLSGEKLSLDMKRLEMAYLENNARQYEITKQVSLLQLNPMAMIALKETGICELEIPEFLFDMDYPGHYMRRIKNVSLTIPCVIGPYTGIHCTLTLLSNKTRINNETLPNNEQGYPELTDQDDLRIVTTFGALQSIATSHGQNDSGLFELNFRDERYLPFEGAGVISHWRVEMTKEFSAFDFDTISDVIFHLRYTAKEGGELLKTAAKNALNDNIANAEQSPLARLFSIKHEFPDQWHRILEPSGGVGGNLILDKNRFSYQFQGRTIDISTVELFIKFSDNNFPDGFRLFLANEQMELTQDTASKLFTTSTIINDSLPVTLNIRVDTVESSNIVEDIFLLAKYSVTQ